MKQHDIISVTGLSLQRESRLNLDFASHASLYLQLGVFLLLFGDFSCKEAILWKMSDYCCQKNNI